MRVKREHNGAALLIVVFLASLMSVLVIGMLQINTEELQLMRNQINAAESLATAEAGLNHALSEIRADSGWDTGFTGTSFNGGSYTVTVSGNPPDLTLESTGTSAQGFETRIEAEVTVATSGPPHVIRIDSVRINE
jgi:Tfp pilus assembly protein PilX